MANNKQKKLQNSKITINDEQFKAIQQISFYTVFDPFEISEGLKLVRKARVGLENSVIQPVSKKITPYKKPIINFKDSLLTKIKNTSLIKLKNPTKQPEAYNNLKVKYHKIEQKFKDQLAIQTDRALNFIFEKNLEKIVIQKSQTILKKNLSKIEQIQFLNQQDRELLLNSLYPFEIALNGKIKKSINSTFNIALGVLVATNIPFTGASVNLITTIKTVIYLSNRIQLLSAIYGYPVICKEALFTVATKIVASVIDYESNPKHQPLSPKIIAELYQFKSQSTLYELLKKATIKDLYISIPLVGSLSLAKITLDEQSITKLTLQLFKNYFALEKLKKELPTETLNKELSQWKQIYQIQKTNNSLKKFAQNSSDNEDNQKKYLLQKVWFKVKNLEKREAVVLDKMHEEANEIYKQFKKEKDNKNL